MVKKTFFLCLLLSLVCCTAVFAQGENLTLKIAVIGPGDELYFWWGHIALIIEDSQRGRSDFYDYGLFSFDNDNFFYNFAFGRLLYCCGVSPTEQSIYGYIEENRTITIYTLDVPPEKRIEVRDFANFNVLPANRDYFYHHFKDNCSTRIRDIIDLAVDGQFYAQYGNAPGRFTFRQHVRRHTWFSPAADWFLSFLMGQGIDTPVTIWKEMFLPAEVGSRIEDFWYTDANNVSRKLVTSIEVFNTAKGRARVLDVPRKQWPRELIFSSALSAVFVFFFFLQKKKERTGVVLSGISVSLCGFVFGTAGLLLYFMNMFTNHDYTYNNMNMLFFSPLLIALVPLGICYAAARNNEKRITYDAFIRLIWLLTLIGVLISIFIKLFPGFYQQNLTDQMLILPIALVFTFQPVGLKETAQRFLKRKYVKAEK
jgi:hypothetical protein